MGYYQVIYPLRFLIFSHHPHPLYITEVSHFTANEWKAFEP